MKFKYVVSCKFKIVVFLNIRFIKNLIVKSNQVKLTLTLLW